MKITSFDELQREITRLTHEAKMGNLATVMTNYNSAGSSLSSYANILLTTVDNLEGLRSRLGNAQMSMLNPKLLEDMDACQRYSKKIHCLTNRVVEQLRSVQSLIKIAAETESIKCKFRIPDFVGPLLAAVDASMVCGYWTYAVHPESFIDDIRYGLFYRIDLDGVLSLPMPSAEKLAEKVVDEEGLPAPARMWDNPYNYRELRVGSNRGSEVLNDSRIPTRMPKRTSSLVDVIRLDRTLWIEYREERLYNKSKTIRVPFYVASDRHQKIPSMGFSRYSSDALYGTDTSGNLGDPIRGAVSIARQCGFVVKDNHKTIAPMSKKFKWDI